MSGGAHRRSQWLYPALVVLVGWTLMAAYAVTAYLERVPRLAAPRTGISMIEWVELDEMRLRVAHVWTRHLKLQLIPRRHAGGQPRPSRTSRWFHRLRGKTIPWNGDDVPVAGWAARVEEWPDVDVWIVGPLVFSDYAY
ncbi:MAG: hypothetical protein IPJ98_18395 [Bryobacterales bacterium]|nr:hypothetical protein [Bryobacterales bacterium]